MILDEIDIKILKIFSNLKEEEETTTWKIMLQIFSECLDDFEKRKKHMLIKRRIRRMYPNLFEIKKVKGFYEYSLIDDNVKFCKHKFMNGYKDCLMVLVDSKWMVFEL